MNKEIPLVSVSVVTYNHEKYIEQCLDSILNQKTDFDFEIVLGEDDSTDGTRSICKRYALNHPDKIKLFLRSREDVIYINGNPTGRFNFIENLKSARGKYIALCEGDDYWTDPLKLQKQVDFLERNENFVLSCHNSNIINTNGVFIKLFNNDDTPEITDVTYLLQNSWYIPTASSVFRNNLTTIPKWFLTVLNGDYSLYLLLTSNGGLIHYDKEIRSAYRKHDQGLSNVFTTKNIMENSMIKINKLFIKHTNGKYYDSCANNIEMNSFKIINNEKFLSKDFLYRIISLIWFQKSFSKKLFALIVKKLQ